jgi:hypothetical protein
VAEVSLMNQQMSAHMAAGVWHACSFMRKILDTNLDTLQGKTPNL